MQIRWLALLALVTSAALAAPASGSSREWAWPVRGEVVESFRLGADPFAARQHRGIDIAAPVGAPVRAACGGRVRFAGTAGTAGRTVTVACGGFAVTYLHLSSLAVRAGERVRRGARLGAVGTSGRPRSRAPHLHLGVRRAGDRFGYVDPLALLPPEGAARIPPVPPVGRAPRARPAGPPPVRAPLPAGARAPEAEAAAPKVPAPVWAGVALLILAAPAGAAVRVRRRRRRGQSRAKVATNALASSARASQSS